MGAIFFPDTVEEWLEENVNQNMNMLREMAQDVQKISQRQGRPKPQKTWLDVNHIIRRTCGSIEQGLHGIVQNNSISYSFRSYISGQKMSFGKTEMPQWHIVVLMSCCTEILLKGLLKSLGIRVSECVVVAIRPVV